MNYTLEEILQECSVIKKLISEKKNRERMDRRNYLIALLHYKYKFTEKRVAEELGMTREAIPSSKLQAYQLMSINDVSFIANVNDYILKYPYDFPDADKLRETKRKSDLTIKLHQNVVKKLRAYAGIKQIRIDVAAVNLITKGLDLWEK
jgi:hypothetical protein